MKLNKAERKQVRDKSSGLCWYCGCDLPDKGWHADHLEPVYREGDGEMWKPQHDHMDNIVPACAPCNLFKSAFSVEQFRTEISLQIARARKSSVNFRTAERFGLLNVQDKPVKFWFEANKEKEHG